MKTDLPTRKPFEERLIFSIDSELKRRAFERAAQEGISASTLLRRALAQHVEQSAA